MKGAVISHTKKGFAALALNAFFEHMVREKNMNMKSQRIAVIIFFQEIA